MGIYNLCVMCCQRVECYLVGKLYLYSCLRNTINHTQNLCDGNIIAHDDGYSNEFCYKNDKVHFILNSLSDKSFIGASSTL